MLTVVVLTVIIPLICRDEIVTAGEYLLNKFGRKWFDSMLFVISAVSSTPLAFPVWTYAVYGTIIGYETMRIVIIVSAGSTCGSYLTYLAGKHFSDTSVMRNRFPELSKGHWSAGKSVWSVSLILFTGTVFPFPIDIVYAVCGMKRYPGFLFCVIVFAGKVLTYYMIVSFWYELQEYGLLSVF